MSTFDKQSFYYSGQGVVMIGGRDEFGRPTGLVPVANVSALSIAIEEAVEEHKESQSGQRGVDLRLPTETTCTLNMMMESFIADNLAIALRAGIEKIVAGSETAEEVNGYLGKVSPLQHIKVSSVVVNKAGGSALTLYTDDDTPWDYKLNPDAGSIMLNAPGGLTPMDTLTGTGVAITGVVAGTQTKLLIADTSTFMQGGTAYVTTIVGTGGLDLKLNLRTHQIVTIEENVSVTLSTNTTGGVWTSGGLALGDLVELEVDYDYDAQNRVDALTEGAKDRYLRFEGLNTADDLRPVVIEVFKFQTSPLAELALINEGITGFELEGSVLADALQNSGSKYFKQTLLR